MKSAWKLYALLIGLGASIAGPVSADLRELMAVCDRIAVLSEGRLAATFERGGFSEEKINAAAFSEHIKNTRTTQAKGIAR